MTVGVAMTDGVASNGAEPASAASKAHEAGLDDLRATTVPTSSLSNLGWTMLLIRRLSAARSAFWARACSILVTSREPSLIVGGRGGVVMANVAVLVGHHARPATSRGFTGSRQPKLARGVNSGLKPLSVR